MACAHFISVFARASKCTTVDVCALEIMGNIETVVAVATIEAGIGTYGLATKASTDRPIETVKIAEKHGVKSVSLVFP